MAEAGSTVEEPVDCWAEEVADARVTSREETLSIIEGITLQFLQDVASGVDPTLQLISRSERNVVRDERGHTHLGKVKVTKTLFGKKAVGSERFAKIWQVLALIQRILTEGKCLTQRDAYYTLIQHFRHQSEFNDTLQDIVALTGCARSSLGLCASSSGLIAGCLLWKEEGVDPLDCSASAHGKAIPGHVQGITFESLGARYILIVEKDAVFMYLCGQRLWDSLPCILVTGCGYPSLSVRALVRSLSTQLALPVLGLFDYNPHGLQILLTYKLGSIRMGLESHAYTADMLWLGLHHQDIVQGEEEGGRIKVDQAALQQWSVADERVFSAVRSRVESTLGPAYCREVALMNQLRMKVEIEAINTSSTGNAHLDSLENTIIRKIVRKKYF